MGRDPACSWLNAVDAMKIIRTSPESLDEEEALLSSSLQLAREIPASYAASLFGWLVQPGEQCIFIVNRLLGQLQTGVVVEKTSFVCSIIIN